MTSWTPMLLGALLGVGCSDAISLGARPGEADLDAGPRGIVALAVSDGACALRADGTVLCLPWPGSRAAAVALRGARSVSVGAPLVCAIDVDGRARCGDFGEDTSVPVEGPRDVVELAAGGPDVCATDRAGQVWCGHAEGGVILTRRVPLDGISGLSVGWGYACGLRGDEAWCWRVAPTTYVVALPDGGLPRRIATGVQAVAAGATQACVLTRWATVRCWGARELDGDGVGVPEVTGATSVSAGYGVACALRADGAWCWGDNAYGKLGTGEVGMGIGPSRVVGSDGFSRIAAGILSVCAARGEEVWCWGLVAGWPSVTRSNSETNSRPLPQRMALP